MWRRLKNISKKKLIAYLTAGDPSLSGSEQLILAFSAAGADLIELGIPFSDPLADGPVIQASHQRALKKGMTLTKAFQLVGKLKRKLSVPLVFMLSYNLVYRHGEKKFWADCRRYGVAGAVVPDFPLEERRATGPVALVRFVSPTSSSARIKKAGRLARGFVYLIAVAGITGQRRKLSTDLPTLVKKVKRSTKQPVLVGFGISTPDQAAEVCRWADGVIVGSALVDLIAKKQPAKAITLVEQMRRAIDAR